MFIENGVYAKLEREIQKRRTVTTEKNIYKVMNSSGEKAAVRDLPGGPMVRISRSLQRAWV